MNLNVLHLDDAFDGQVWFMDRCNRSDANHVDLRKWGPQIRLWGRTRELEELGAVLSTRLSSVVSDAPLVTWYGSGDFHHVTALIVRHLSQSICAPLTVVHFDNHPDWVKFSGGVHCGSWVSHLLGTDHACQVISVGVSSRDLAWPEFKGADLRQLMANKHMILPLDPPMTLVVRDYGTGRSHLGRGGRIAWKYPLQIAGPGNLSPLIKLIGTGPVYITIDKDVLTTSEAATNWDQGSIHVDEIIHFLSSLIARCNIVGIDVLGDYSLPRYSGTKLDVIWKKSEAFLDQPAQTLSPMTAAQINEATNLKLFERLGAQLC